MGLYLICTLGFLLQFFRVVVDLVELNEEKTKYLMANLVMDAFLMIVFLSCMNKVAT